MRGKYHSASAAGASGEPDDSVITLHNLSRSAENAVIAGAKMAQLEAGYDNQVGIIFDGSVSRVEQERGTHTRQTVLVLGPKEGALDAAFIEVTAPEGESQVPVRDAVSQVIEALGLTPGDLSELTGMVDAPIYGYGRGLLDSLLLPRGFDWFEDGGVVNLNKVGAEVRRAGERVISQVTGMIASPKQTDEGMRVQIFLDPSIELAQTVQVDSEVLTGRYKVAELGHQGDNWTGRFLTTIEGQRL